MSGVEKQNNIREVLQDILRPLPNKICIATSGGIDSSALVVSALDIGKEVQIISFTFKDWFSHDFKSAHKLAKKFNLTFVPVYLPNDENEIIETVKHLIKKVGCEKKSAIECMFPFFYVAKRMNYYGDKTLVTGIAADGHFGLSKKAMIHYSKDNAKFKKLRQDYFSNMENAGTKKLIKIFKMHNLQISNPYFEPSVFSLWIDKNWEQLNKPRQKEAIRKFYPELDELKIKPHTNLQLGDSMIAQRVGNAVISKYKPYAKSPVGIYNRIAKGIYA
jgi:asparagine synthetase B (glutamine-hydrolysing)|tara:strand:+ start:277 stop:1101 length:825 start_codon:yes stop_codon:yes gene_type:complete